MGLASTQVGDTVIRRGLVHCPQLLKVNLSKTRITDQGTDMNLKGVVHFKTNPCRRILK